MITNRTAYSSSMHLSKSSSTHKASSPGSNAVTAAAEGIRASFSTSVSMHNILRGAYVYAAEIIYNNILYSSNKDPAILYKLRDTVLFFNFFIPPNSLPLLTANGRIYKPQAHCWAINSVWVLAHIHKNHEFMVVSPVTDDNIFRYHKKTYSAFAKEIASVMNAGYYVSKITSNKHGAEIIYLSPAIADSDLRKLTIKDCQPDEMACHRGIDQFQASLQIYTHFANTLTGPTKAPQNNINKLIASDTAKKQKLKTSTSKISQIISIYSNLSTASSKASAGPTKKTIGKTKPITTTLSYSIDNTFINRPTTSSLMRNKSTITKKVKPPFR